MEEALQSSRFGENCYIPPCATSGRYKDKDCLRFCIYRCNGITWTADKHLFLTKILNLFSCYTAFAESIYQDNQKAWELLWNDDVIIVNAAQQVLWNQYKIVSSDLENLSALTYEGKRLEPVRQNILSDRV